MPQYQQQLLFQRSIKAPDGFSKSIVTVNGIFPGPMIRVSVGDQVSITVVNLLGEDEMLSIHWHGIDQVGTPWYDGAAGVTNCPISYRTNYTYSFSVPESGTYWYHNHFGSARGEGGYGMFIVDDLKPIAVYDSEIPLILTDWYHQSANLIDAGLHSFGPTMAAVGTMTSTGFSWPGNGDSLLVNGIGRANVYIDVVPNKIYRIRVLNAASLAYFNFAVAGHNVTIVSCGGTPIEPVSLPVLSLGSGERYDVLLSTYGKSIAQYRINLQTNYRGNDITTSGVFNTLFLRYAGSAGVISQIVPYNASTSWSYQQSRLFTKAAFTTVIPASTVTLFMNMSEQYTDPETKYGLGYTSASSNRGYLRWTVNQQSFQFPRTPLLLSSYCQLLNSNSYGQASLPIKLKYGDVAQLIIQNRAALNGRCEQHPWHLHGHAFWVLAQGVGQFDPAIHTQLFNLRNPLLTDTIVSYPTLYAAIRQTQPVPSSNSQNAHKACGWTAIRFVADNPGLWAFHCHIDWHMTIGMATVFDVSSSSLWSNGSKATLPIDYDTCGFINSRTPNPQVSTPSQTTGGDDSSTSMNSVVLSVAGFSVLVVFTNLFSLIVGAFLMNRWMFRSKKDDKIKGTESAVEFMKQKNTMQHGNEESPPMVDSIPVTNPEL